MSNKKLDFESTEAAHCLCIKYTEWSVSPPPPLPLSPFQLFTANAIKISFAYFYFLLYLIIFLYSANPCKVWMPFIYVLISTSGCLPHPTPEGSWWFLNHYQWVPMNKNEQKVIWGIRENYFPPRQMTAVQSETKAWGLHIAWQPLNEYREEAGCSKNTYILKVKSVNGEGFVRVQRVQVPYWKMTVSAFNYFQWLCSLPVNCTFHCFLARSKHYLPSIVRLRSFWSCARVWVGRDTLVLSCEWWSLLALSKIPLPSCTLHIPWKQY